MKCIVIVLSRKRSDLKSMILFSTRVKANKLNDPKTDNDITCCKVFRFKIKTQAIISWFSCSFLNKVPHTVFP